MSRVSRALRAARRWLAADLTHIRVLEHDIAIRRVHLTTLLLAVVIAAVVAFAAGLGTGRYIYPYRTLPRPPIPSGQTAPKPGCPHTMGGCLPTPKISLSADISASQTGPDLSNNNPVYSPSAWAAIAHRSAFAIFKVTEGTGYVDPTAAPMARQARAHGLVVGGYDFLHVCLDDAGAEARLFASRLRAGGLTGKGSLPPVGDAEWPLGDAGCNARAWLAAWTATVRALTGRQPMIYTGAWWWQPHIGTWWPTGSLAWISGYQVRYPYMPSGRSQLDMWQFTDSGYNGASTSDLSIWRDGAAAFRTASLTTAKPKPSRIVCFGAHWNRRAKACKTIRPLVAKWSRARDASSRAITRTRRGLAANHCRRPWRRDVCVDLGRETLPVLRQRRRYFAASVKAALKRYG